jgi:hypothetical protein
MIMTQQELIEHYEKHLEKVKIMHNPEKAETCLMKDKCNEFIACAKKDLQEVREGREW